MTTGLEMIRPQDIEVEQETLTETFGKLTIQPLERGYGYTLGNALRRVLLSSLSGSAITGIEVEGAVHEFSAVPDIKEDVSELILNLKQVRLKIHGNGPEEMTLDVKGPGVATAGDFEGSQNVELLNPQLVLGHIGESGKLKLRVVAQQGRGFATSEDNKDPDWPLGRMAVDAIFSPVRKVNFHVSNARVGQRTDYDKLVMEIESDGSVSPLDAVSIAAKILQDQLVIFTGVNAAEQAGGQVAPTSAVGGTLNPVFLKPVRELDLQNRSINSMESAGVRYLGDLVQMTETELAAVKNLGKKTLDEVRELLESMGLTMGMKLDGWPPESLEQAEG